MSHIENTLYGGGRFPCRIPLEKDRKKVDFFSKNAMICIDPSCWEAVWCKGVYVMFSKEVIVRCESGLHNKQATYFVQKANEFESSIWLESGSRKMNAKSLLGITPL